MVQPLLCWTVVVLLGFCACDWEDDWDSFADEGDDEEESLGGSEGEEESFDENVGGGYVIHNLPEPHTFDPSQWVFDEVVEPSEELFVDSQYRILTEVEIQPLNSQATILSEWKDPLFVIWVKPLTNHSLEHNWIDDVVLAHVERPIVKVYPEVCHLDLEFWGGSVQNKKVIYVVGAARAPDWLHDCFTREKEIRREIESGAREAAEHTHLGLIHLSDEYIGPDYGICEPDDHIGRPVGYVRCQSRIVLYYDIVDFVLRNHWHESLNRFGEKVSWFPLGTTNGFGMPMKNAIIPASFRKLRCSLRAMKWESRQEIFDVLTHLKEEKILECTGEWYDTFGTGMPKAGFRQELLQTIFAPAPTGNYNPDTYRFYEALSSGCIPIIKSHPEWDILGDHPIPMLDSWGQITQLIDYIEAKGLDIVQQQIFSWWSNYLVNLQNRVADLVA